MNFFSDEQNSELRDLFFEGAAELVQALNEEGLEWEKDPADAGIARRIRRTVHTLKGDSAAAGFTELSELAHALEDALSDETVAAHALEIAELVLRAADSFSEMLSLYRDDKSPASQDELLSSVRELVARSKSGPSEQVQRLSFSWSEYEQLLIDSALAAGDRLLSVVIRANPRCAVAVTLQMVRNVLEQSGTIVCIAPESAIDTLNEIRAVVSTQRDISRLSSRCLVPGVTTHVSIEELPSGASSTSKNDFAGPGVPTPPPVPPVPAGPAGDPKAAPCGAPSEPAAPLNAPENSLRVDSARIDAALNLLGELIIGKSMLTQ
ncbi:MAG: Hpt domain-containing protein, partial [Terriglobales bacterium]